MRRYVRGLSIGLLCGLPVAESSTAQTRLADARAINGLEVTAASATLQLAQDPEFRLFFHNVSSESLRLPGPIDPPDLIYWRIVARDRDTGAVVTGVQAHENRGCVRIDGKPLVATPVLRPGERIAAAVGFSGFGFVPGAVTRTEARSAVSKKLPPPCTRPRDELWVEPSIPQELRLPPGRYIGSIDVDFPIEYASIPGPPIWYGGVRGAVTTNEFEFSVVGR